MRYLASNQHVHLLRTECSVAMASRLLWEKRARGDLAGAAEAAHRTPHGKRVVAAEQNDLISSTHS
ncbi:hypothetical protein Q0N12_08440 [Rossellomorea marisflavi]|uniref:hypothetical protein n=1 Tax=Rossellomorea marisflavi TaxID=189381 RepID=UPI00345AA069